MGKGALSGLRVIDFGQYIAGPLAAVMLADYGADVIHVDPPGGPRWNAYEANAVLMRGKRNIILDLNDPDDRETARRLIATADVVIENFRPGVMGRFGLGKENFFGSNPALIYCSIPGFAACDPRAGLPGWEGIVAAEAGVYTDVMQNKTRFNALPMASVFAAAEAVHGIIASLIVRERCGRGQSVETPLYDACFEVEGIRGIDPPPVRPAMPANGKTVVRDYDLFKYLTKYPTKDGRYITITPPPRGVKKMVEAFIPPGWADHRELTPEEDRELRALVASKTALEWERTAQESYQAGVVAAQTSAEWLRDESAVDSRTVVPVNDPLLGATMQPGAPSLMLGSGDCAGTAPRHLPDADREEILRELPLRKPPQIRAAGTVAPALAGIKVLDFCQVLAGPISGRIMAEYGAEVIKINNPRTEENPIAMVGHETVNNGKLTTFIDLKSGEGRAVLDTLIRECDIFHCNFSQPVYERLGITEEQLREKNPEIILSQVNVHSLGGWRQWERGHEDLGESVSGLSCRYSGSLKPETIPILICDNLTGQFSAIGAMLAVYHRMRTGKGQRVQACLSRSATLAQIPYMLEYAGKIWDEPSGPDAKGWDRFDRIYETADGAIFLAGADMEKLRRSGAFDAVDPASEGAEAAMEEIFRGSPSQTWVETLCPLGCAVRALRNFADDCMEEDYAKARGLSRRDFHPGIGTIRTTSCAPRLSMTPPVGGNAVCAPGGDTERFLARFQQKDTEHR